MMRNFLACALLAGATFAASAQPPPPEFTELLGNKDATGDVLTVKKHTAEQRAFIWKDTTRGPDGYLRVQHMPDYLKLVADFRSNAKKARPGKVIARLRPGYVLPKGMVFGGSIPEDQYRTTLVFDDAAGGAALTVWNFRQAGAKVSVVEEVLNQVIGGRRGTLALTVANGHTNALWKLAWFKEGISYELYVPDVLNREGLPARRSAHIVTMGAALANQLLIAK